MAEATWGAELVGDSIDVLSESPVWDRVGLVSWIDLLTPVLNRMAIDGSCFRRIELDVPLPLGMIVATCDPDKMVLACRAGLVLVDLRTAATTFLADPNQGRPEITYNDGKVDRSGRLWVGTSDAREIEPRGILYRRRAEGGFDIVDAGFAVSNGPAFSPDGSIMYFSDTTKRRILAYDIGHHGLPVGFRRVFAELAEGEGMPDGLTVDVEGHLWCAHWGGWRVSRFAPDGKRVGQIVLPVPLVTACCFAGPDLRTLIITTARDTLAEEQLANAPLSGRLFRCRPGLAGLPERPLRLDALYPGEANADQRFQIAET